MSLEIIDWLQKWDLPSNSLKTSLNKSDRFYFNLTLAVLKIEKGLYEFKIPLSASLWFYLRF